MVESEFVRTETIRNTTNYHLMESGKEALSMFHTQISEPIKKDILDYFAEKNTSSEKKWISLPTITLKRNGENIW